MKLYTSILRPFFFRFDPEKIHHLSLEMLCRTPIAKFLEPFTKVSYSKPVRLWGITFPNPIGLAAGFDKEAVGLPAWEKLGFGSVEIGTVTRHAQPGNERPRIFRFPEHQALVNSLGFPNGGAKIIAKRLEGFKSSGRWPNIPVGINIGKSKITPIHEAAEDYLFSFKTLYPYADYFAVNVSSPNTVGLRVLQEKDALLRILNTLKANTDPSHPKPLLVKIAPDLSYDQIADILECIATTGTDGIIAANTTIDKTAVNYTQNGGLSGAPLREKSTDIIRFISQETQGNLPIIGIGGIFTADHAKEKLDAGASLLQAYTGFIYQGPTFCRQICHGLEI